MMARLTAFTVSVESSISRHRVVRLHAEQKVGSRETASVRFPGSTILATTVGSWRRSQRRQRSSAESCLNQDEERIYAKELSDEAEWPCATKEA